MAKKLWEVPFTFTMTGARLVLASDADEARTLASEGPFGFVADMVPDSGVFWDADGNIRTVGLKCVAPSGREDDLPQWGDPVESDEDPAEHGFAENEDEAEAEDDGEPGDEPEKPRT